MTGLAEILKRRIAIEGPLSIADYMSEALGHPVHGYYRGKDRLGGAGDFVTAPEISQMFGELIGLWSAVVWKAMGSPKTILVVELGPGRGTLMADFLRAARAVPAFIEALDLHLVETSPGFQACQSAVLADAGLPRPPRWHETLAGVPVGPAILVANEFFDALPIRQFEKTRRGWRERLVDVDPESGAFRFTRAPKPAESRRFSRMGPAPVGGIVEICPTGLALATAIGRRLRSEGGAALIIDYGPAKSGFGDSLQAVRAHAFHDVLQEPGRADLTAHVDFAALAEAAAVAGAAVHGPVNQRDFLDLLGIGARLNRLLAAATPKQTRELTSGFRRLMVPERMGTLFKAIAFCHPSLKSLPGFDDGSDAAAGAVPPS